MKDVAICDKPRGADEQALIRGCPNAATQLCAAQNFQIPKSNNQINPNDRITNDQNEKFSDWNLVVDYCLIIDAWLLELPRCA
jgi:hypothetical protein